MSVRRVDIDTAKRIFYARLGNPYIYGGGWQADNEQAGTDCSGLWDVILSAAVGRLQWGRPAEGATTEAYRYIPIGGAGPFGTIRAAHPTDIPTTAAAKLAFHHEGSGGAASHMWGELDGVRMESAGSKGCVTAPQAWPIDHPYANAWAYLPGPITEDTTMTVRGLDYAGGRPAAAAIKAAGYTFVVRYLSDGGPSLPGKLLTPAEADDLRGNGISIVSNWETTADRMLGGYAAGITDAQRALNQVIACGGRTDRPIYFSADWDATPAQQAQIDDYLRGAASVIGVENTGIYGGYWPVSRALNNGTARWAWQTEAWSGTNREPKANLLQRNSLGYAYVGGVQCDINEALTGDYGQWDWQATPAAPRIPDDLSDRQLAVETWDQLRGPGGRGWPQLDNLTPVDSLALLHQKADQILAALTQKEARP